MLTRSGLIEVLLLATVLVASTPAVALVSEGDSPTLEVSNVAGGSISLAELRGSVVLVDFWATWCGPCQRSLPFYAELLARHGDAGLVVLAVSIDDRLPDVERYLSSSPLPFLIGWDADHSVVESFEPPTMPTAYLVDRDGVVRYVHVGFRSADRDEFEARIIELLGSETASTPTTDATP